MSAELLLTYIAGCFVVAAVMAVTAACDSAYAVAAGGMGATISGRGRRLLARGSGLIPIAGGAWLAALRR